MVVLHDGHGRGSWRGPLWLLSFAVSTLGMMGATLVQVFRLTRAVPPEEFPASAVLFSLAGPMATAHVAGALVFAALVLWELAVLGGASAVCSLGLVLALAGEAASFVHGLGALIAALGLYIAFVASQPRVEHRGPPQALRAAPEVLLLPAAAFAVAVMLELRLYTWPLVLGRFTLGDFARFAALTVSAAVLAGARLGLELALVLVVWRRVSGSLLALSAISGLYFWARTTDLFLYALGNEVSALHLTWMVYLLFGLLGILIAIWTQAGLVAAFRHRPPADYRDLLGALAQGFACPLSAPLLRSSPDEATGRRRAAAGAIAFLLLYAALLLELNYPHFTDYAAFLQSLYSTLIGYVVFALIFIVYTWPGRRPTPSPGVLRSPAAAAAILGTALLTYAALSGGQVIRLMAAQYSKIALRAIDLARVVPERPLLPLRPTAPPPPAEELRRMERFPAYAAQDLYAKSKRRPPIFVVLWDAARPDHLSAYGYARRTSPAVESLAADGVLFERAYASATATSASLRHLFTGKYSSRYMLATDHAPFFTGALLSRGYDRLAINILGSDFNGVSREAFLRNQPQRQALEPLVSDFHEYDEPSKTRRALELLDEHLTRHRAEAHPADGLFMFLHYTATHYPWRRSDDTPDYGDAPGDRFDGATAHLNRWLAVLVDGLKSRGIYSDAIIVFTADHGSGLGERGTYGGFQPYEEQVRVPLIIKAPGFAPGRVAEPVSGLDLAPTLVSLLSAGEPNPYDGFSLLPLMEGTAQRLDRRFLLSQSAFEDALALIDVEQGFKLHLHRSARYVMLYDLRQDPGERVDLADQEPGRVAAYVRVLQAYLWRGRGTYANPFHYRPPP